MRSPPPLGIYVHFPWCLNKCPYCDFLSVAAARPEIPQRPYTDAVLDELDRRVAELGAHRLRSVFFGGGTPSLWEPDDLGRVLASIKRYWPSANAEVTVECNPSSFDDKRAASLRAVGVNRISLGIQSLDNERLRFLGRLHDAGGALRAVESAISAGFAQVSTDLIFGIAGESPAEAAGEAVTLVKLGVTHLSAYALTVEPGTRFGALARKGRLPQLGDDAVAESFVAVDEAVTARGFEHYEISNYARPGCRSAHNVGYWKGDDYLGLGCGAWGTVTMGNRRVRYRNTTSPERYIAACGTWSTADLLRSGSDTPIHTVEPIDGETALRECLMLGLRLAEGIDVERAASLHDVEPWPRARERAVDRLLAAGRLCRDGARLWVPKNAWLLADGTIAELM